MSLRSALIFGATSYLVACSGFTTYEECQPGESASCEALCGPGTMHCDGGSWGACQPNEDPVCLPGEYGTCELAPGQPPGLWMCSDTCVVGPCIELCNPGDEFECEGICGIRGRQTCQDDGSWGGCVEYVNPVCRPSDVEVCEGDDGPGHRRCDDECDWGECDGSLECFPGESANCGQCASQSCGDDGVWQECEPYASTACVPGNTRECRGACGTGTQFCSEWCEWSECFNDGACMPGQRQICATALYCGIAYRFCGPNCNWLPCVEVGG